MGAIVSAQDKERKKKTVTVTFRIPETDYSSLSSEALRQNVSLNTLVAQIFADFETTRHIQKMGMYRVTRTTFLQLLNALSNEKLEEVARHSGGDVQKSFMLSKYGSISLTTVLDSLKSFSEFTGMASYNEIETNGRRVVSMVHSLGSKASTYFVAPWIMSLFELIGEHPKLVLTENSVVIEIP